MLRSLGERSKQAAKAVAQASGTRRDAALLAAAGELERRGDEVLVAALVAAVGQGVGWDVAVVASERRALVAHRVCGPPLALSIADEGRLIDAGDLREEADLWWRCPHEIAELIGRRSA